MSLRKTTLLYIFIASIIVTACEGDFRSRAQGAINEVFVVMDSTQFNSKTAEAIRSTYGKYQFHMLNPEENYNLTFTDIRSNAQLDRLKGMKNVIFAGVIDDTSNVSRAIRGFLDAGVEARVKSGESFAFPIKDQWYKDQYALILSSTSDSALAEKIINSERSLIADIQERELSRWTYEVYEKKEQTQYSDSMWAQHGFKVRIQHDYFARIDTNDFISFRRNLQVNDRWVWVWWKDNVSDIGFLDSEWINATRDSLNEQYIKGSNMTKYVTTEYNDRIKRRVNSFQKGRLIGYETQGWWTMVNAAMGGPFVNFTYYDPATNRLFMIEYSQFAPSVKKKLPFVRQFRAMGRTFESDSTWNQSSS
jgi:hypothetical protein